MARGTRLEKVLYALKAELGAALTPGAAPANDDILLTKIERRQELLYTEYSWPFLRDKADVAIVAQARYATLPTTLNFDRPVQAESIHCDVWHPLCYGIGAEEYNAISSGDGDVEAQYQDPVFRWCYKPGDDESFEVWPRPASATTVRFWGQKPLTSLRDAATGGFNFNRVATVDLDDTMIIHLVAYEILLKHDQKEAGVQLKLAEARIARLRGTSPVRHDSFRLGEGTERSQGYYYRKPRVG